MDSFKIRQSFLDFFKKHGHTIVPSSSLIPAEDPTLLFTNAGMNQFKDLFLGKEKRDYVRATSSQKCVRAGGKHNDLDEVGFSNRHLTFFEMLGNFSFGDYFKKEAIEFAWQFLTKDMKLPIENLVATVYKDDDQAYDLWHKTIGIPKEKMYRLGEKDNFWQMGDTGPCGPCSEIHFDHGKNVGCKEKECSPACDCQRFTEIWNLVFMQYSRQKDGTLLPLKQTGVDTGMGLERLCMIKQDKDSVFELDMFAPMLKKIEDVCKISYTKSDENTKAAFHVVLDHVRSSCLLIADGCAPSNDGRGYVLRKIIRRAALFAQKLTDNQKLFTIVANEFITFMSPVYPELKTNHDFIIKLLDGEIERFSVNLIQGQNILEKYLEENRKANNNKLSGEQVFKLYDTYGFPTELTNAVAKENNFELDMAGFEKEMEKQQKQSGKKTADEEVQINVDENISTDFQGYEKLETETKITFVQEDIGSAWIVTEQSPFYVESGGQVSDTGWLKINDKVIKVIDLKKTGSTNKPAIAVKISLKEIGTTPKVGDKVTCVVDAFSRSNAEKNHTATHMLQAALVQMLGKHIKQAGSLVDKDHLRFDFTNPEGLSKEQISEIETIVNNKIQENIKLDVSCTTLAKATEAGVTAFFGEKYNPGNVRVVKIPGFSAELCGGTHIKSTGQIGCFKIVSDVALSSGVRRITGVTGPKAIKLFQQSFDITKKLGEKFKVKAEQILPAIEKQQENMQAALSQIKQLKKQMWKTQIPTWQQQVRQVGKVPFLFLGMKNGDASEFKNICQAIEQKSPGCYLLITTNEKTAGRISFFGFVSKKWTKEVNLKDLSKLLKDKFDFKGGGSTTMIQGGGNKTDFDKVKIAVEDWIKVL